MSMANWFLSDALIIDTPAGFVDSKENK